MQIIYPSKWKKRDSQKFIQNVIIPRKCHLGHGEQRKKRNKCTVYNI